MSSLAVDVFVEDRAHEELVIALVRRIAGELKRSVEIRPRAARGGHGRVLKELAQYQKLVMLGAATMSLPDVLVVAIDTNCHGLTKRKQEIRKQLRPAFRNRTVIAAPDPHVERWYLADDHAFRKIVGIEPPKEPRKCERDRYKKLLLDSVRQAGHPAILDGIEFGRELAQHMDFYRVGKSEPSFKQFVDDAQSVFKRAPA
jgi:hypothetical protein